MTDLLIRTLLTFHLVCFSRNPRTRIDVSLRFSTVAPIEGHSLAALPDRARRSLVIGVCSFHLYYWAVGRRIGCLLVLGIRVQDMMDHGCAPSPEFAFAHLVVELLLIRVYHERILEFFSLGSEFSHK